MVLHRAFHKSRPGEKGNLSQRGILLSRNHGGEHNLWKKEMGHCLQNEVFH